MAFAHATDVSNDAYKPKVERISDQDIKSRLENISSVIDLNYTHEVGRRIREYTVNYRKAGERILGRVDLYFPLIETEISKRDLPDELKYVAVVESNLEPTARSKSGAVGLWQFISSTGKMQGLKIDNYIDERRDPEKSTKAALEYLSDLYDSFDDWTLAIAAYNCGPGNVRKAIRRGNSKDYWEIRHHLPRETQKYVPRIIAAIYLMQYYHVHKLVPDLIDKDMRNTIKISDGRSHNFLKLSKELGVSYNVIKALNPQFSTKYFPKNTGHLSLVIPQSKFEKYLEVYDEVSYENYLEKRREEELKKEQDALEKLKRPNVEPFNYLEAVEPPKHIYSEAFNMGINISL